MTTPSAEKTASSNALPPFEIFFSPTKQPQFNPSNAEKVTVDMTLEPSTRATKNLQYLMKYEVGGCGAYFLPKRQFCMEVRIYPNLREVAFRFQTQKQSLLQTWTRPFTPWKIEIDAEGTITSFLPQKEENKKSEEAEEEFLLVESDGSTISSLVQTEEMPEKPAVEYVYYDQIKPLGEGRGSVSFVIGSEPFVLFGSIADLKDVEKITKVLKAVGSKKLDEICKEAGIKIEKLIARSFAGPLYA